MTLNLQKLSCVDAEAKLLFCKDVQQCLFWEKCSYWNHRWSSSSSPLLTCLPFSISPLPLAPFALRLPSSYLSLLPASTMGSRTFSWSAPRLWNSLPHQLKNIDSLPPPSPPISNLPLKLIFLKMPLIFNLIPCMAKCFKLICFVLNVLCSKCIWNSRFNFQLYFLYSVLGCLEGASK